MQYLPEEIETEEGTDEQESACNQESTSHSKDNFVWTSTGTESEDEDVNVHVDDNWHPTGESTGDEGTTEDEDEISEDQNYIK